jgi:hypothetical protein
MMDREIDSQSRMRKVKDMLYEKQYDTKIPYWLIFISDIGLVVISILILLAYWNPIVLFVLVLSASYPLYRFLAPNRIDRDDMYLIVALGNLIEYLKRYAFKKRTK